ncbi:MAG: hypothetical protein RI894_896 [Bacteroidota bacterium]|jgi:hypothetical protein
MKNILIILLLFLTKNTFAQKEDYTIFSGYDSEFHIDYPRFGNTKTNFNTMPVTIQYEYHANLDVVFAFSSVSTSDGKLLFYTEGSKVLDSTHHTMLNGNGINIGSPLIDGGGGYWYNNGVLIIPRPNTTQYYLFQSFVGEIPYPNLWRYTILKYSTIDMALNNGKGAVIDKNRIVDTTWLNTCLLSATRHANGRDWWLVTQNDERNTFYTYLISPQGITKMPSQTTDLPHIPDWGGSNCQSNFSADGSKFVYGDLVDGATLFDFDRCTGIFGNKRVIPIDSMAGYAGIAFSPNSRFLYIVRYTYILQVDTEAADILTSVDTVARYDGFYYGTAPYLIYTPFHLPYSTPDGRIFVNSGGGSNRYLHTIENPNAQGSACNVQQHSIFLPANNDGTTPNFPTYRLGALAGSGCDTLAMVATGNETVLGKEGFTVYPNPAANFVLVKSNTITSENLPVFITDSYGRVISTSVLQKGTSQLPISTETWATGVYYCKIESSLYKIVVIK